MSFSTSGGSPQITVTDIPHTSGGYTEVRTWADGRHMYLREGVFHREDGPAFIDAEGNKAWHINGHEHRLDGPAVVYYNADDEYWIEGQRLTYTDWKRQASPLASSARSRLVRWLKDRTRG